MASPLLPSAMRTGPNVTPCFSSRRSMSAGRDRCSCSTHPPLYAPLVPTIPRAMQFLTASKNRTSRSAHPEASRPRQQACDESRHEPHRGMDARLRDRPARRAALGTDIPNPVNVFHDLERYVCALTYGPQAWPRRPSGSRWRSVSFPLGVPSAELALTRSRNGVTVQP
jgi:hypothetical protein